MSTLNSPQKPGKRCCDGENIEKDEKRVSTDFSLRTRKQRARTFCAVYIHVTTGQYVCDWLLSIPIPSCTNLSKTLFILFSWFCIRCLLLTASYLTPVTNYNHGQKSWDKFALVALFQTRQTNSHARIQLHLLTPSPHGTRVGHVYTQFYQTFYILCGRGGGGGVGAEANLETVLFQTPFWNTDNFCKDTSVPRNFVPHCSLSFELTQTPCLI